MKVVEVQHNGDMGMGYLGIKWWGSYVWESKFWENVLKKKIANHQGSTLSGHCMITGFGPFELQWDSMG